jgi:hypothetical protein
MSPIGISIIISVPMLVLKDVRHVVPLDLPGGTVSGATPA